jgi:Skp family chaperone for outer membrane proteins
MRDNILRDIREEVTKRSKAEGYTLVLDTAGESVNQTPLVIYFSGVPDLTNDVLAAINKDAPAGSLTPATEEKK